jgi:hypothetical protein
LLTHLSKFSWWIILGPVVMNLVACSSNPLYDRLTSNDVTNQPKGETVSNNKGCRIVRTICSGAKVACGSLSGKK